MEREQRPSPEEALQPERLGVQPEASKGSAGRLPEPEIWSLGLRESVGLGICQCAGDSEAGRSAAHVRVVLSRRKA